MQGKQLKGLKKKKMKKINNNNQQNYVWINCDWRDRLIDRTQTIVKPLYIITTVVGLVRRARAC